MTGFQLGAATTNGYVLTANASGVGTWQVLPTGVTASGTAGTIAKFTGPSALGNSLLNEFATGIGLGATAPLVTGASKYFTINSGRNTFTSVEIQGGTSIPPASRSRILPRTPATAS
jgi:hypothetical protein